MAPTSSATSEGWRVEEFSLIYSDLLSFFHIFAREGSDLEFGSSSSFCDMSCFVTDVVTASMMGHGPSIANGSEELFHSCEVVWQALPGVGSKQKGKSRTPLLSAVPLAIQSDARRPTHATL